MSHQHYVPKIIASCSKLRWTASISSRTCFTFVTTNYIFPILYPSASVFRGQSFAKMLQAQKAESGVDPDMYPDTHNEAELQNVKDSSIKQKNKKGLPKKRDTHFLCFPLVTDTSVPQLADTLRHFREVTTKPPRSRGQIGKDEKNTESEDPDGTESQPEPAITEMNGDTELEPNTNHAQVLPPLNTDLQILPSIVHRPPGTFHLTLGVMDLSTKEEMDRALSFLQELDYAEIFYQVLSQRDPSQHRDRQDGRDEFSTQISQSRNTRPEAEAKLSSLQRPISPPTIANTSGNPLRFDARSPPQICLAGISTFPSTKSSRVFYAKPSPSPSSPFPLLQFGQAIRRKFREAGFITETRPLVLHATVANMRYATQAKGGRTSKGKSWRFGKDRWREGQVDATEIMKCFNDYGGNVQEHLKGASAEGKAHEFVWAKDIKLDRVAICKMGAEKSDDEVLGMVYPPVSEKKVFS